MVRAGWIAGLLVGLSACAKPTPPPAPPVVVAPAPEREPEPEPEPPPKVEAGGFAIGTFNLQWAFDNFDPERRPKGAREHVARSEDDWAWKRDAIAKILADERLDIVALQELGGERELFDIIYAVQDVGGYEYDYAWLETNDRRTGQQVAVLSRFRMTNVRRLAAPPSKHVVVDIELPDESTLTVVAVHLRGGHFPAYQVKRRKETRALKKAVNRLAKTNPVVVLGTLNSRALPSDDGYVEDAAGILAGRHTRKQANDDCVDSSTDPMAQQTNLRGHPTDRVMVCGLELRGAAVAAEDRIVRDEPRPPRHELGPAAHRRCAVPRRQRPPARVGRRRTAEASVERRDRRSLAVDELAAKRIVSGNKRVGDAWPSMQPC